MHLETPEKNDNIAKNAVQGAGLLPIPIITDVKIKGYTHINRENCLGSFLLKNKNKQI